MTADELRAKFEAWMASREGFPFARQFSNLMWASWQAAHASRDVEVEAMRADRDSWADQASERVRDWDEMRQRAERADTEVEALRKDAERYRWLRENGDQMIGEDRGCGPEWTYWDELDQAIDAAMQEDRK